MKICLKAMFSFNLLLTDHKIRNFQIKIAVEVFNSKNRFKNGFLGKNQIPSDNVPN